MSVLRTEGLAVDLGGRPVLHDLDLTVERGELVAILGPNGAGKTTLLRAVLALVPTRAGRVEVDGRPARRGRTAVGYVPQRHEFAWDFPITVEHAVLSGRIGRIGRWRRAGVDDWAAVGAALDRVELGDLRRRPVGELSGGQRQRVLVARALALEPAVLLLDEPATGLDMPTQELLSVLFSRLTDEGTAVVMTTHDILGALQSSDRLVLLNKTVIAHGPPPQLRDEQLWMKTFEVGALSPLLKILQVV